MKTLKNILATLTLVTIAAVSVNAQTINEASAISEATIITPISIAKAAGGDLNFGNIVALATQETVTVGTDGVRSSSNPLSLPTATPGTISAAEFTVSGLAEATYSITLPPAFNVSDGNNNTMEVSAFITDPTPTGTLGSDNTQTLRVGATITVGENQAAGTYTNASDLVITVAYN